MFDQSSSYSDNESEHERVGFKECVISLVKAGIHGRELIVYSNISSMSITTVIFSEMAPSLMLSRRVTQV